MDKLRFIIAPGVRIEPATAFTDVVQKRAGVEADEFIVGKRNSRTRSRVIGSEAAQFLMLFKNPLRIVDAVKMHAVSHGLNPEAFLRTVFPFVQDLRRSGWLVNAEEERQKRGKDRVNFLRTIAGAKIIRCLQSIEETEVFEGLHPRFGRVCIKTCKKTGRARILDSFVREQEIMRRLPRGVAPDLLDAESIDGNMTIVTQWVSGLSASEYCMKLRTSKDGRGILNACHKICEAYAVLHENGFIHCDVHPRNLIIGNSGSVVLVDFGYSTCARQSLTLKDPPRNCIEYFQDPELADSVIKKAVKPKATFEGEQYSIGALLFLLCTGEHYIDFSFDRFEQCRQVLHISPRTLLSKEIPIVDRLNLIIQKMLEKKPENRFRSMREAAVAISKIVTEQAVKRRVQSSRLIRNSWERLIETDISAALTPPTASLNFGRAGVAYALYTWACIDNSAEALARADAWCSRAVHDLNDPTALQNREWKIDPEKKTPSSLFHGKFGALAIQSLISRAMGDEVTERETIHSLFMEARRENCELDVTFGTSGTLLGLARLIKAGVSREASLEVGDPLYSKLIQTFMEHPKIGISSKREEFLGFAHGWVGYLYAALSWCETVQVAPHPVIRKRLDELLSLGNIEGGELSLPKTTSQKRRTKDLSLSSWCNGSAGLVLTLLKAFTIFGDEKYLGLAERGAMHAQRNAGGVTSLCCGSSGVACAQLELSRVTGKEEYRMRVSEMLSPLREHSNGIVPLEHLSLIKGDIGPLFALTALECEKAIPFPFL